MTLIKWTKIYSVNILEVDNQHKKLVDLFNNLYTAMKAGKAKEIMSTTLDELVDYTLYHFATEENLFDKYKFPESEAHKREHKELVEKVAALQKKHQSGERVLTIDVMNFLKDWIHNHIMGRDILFGEFLNSKGVY